MKLITTIEANIATGEIKQFEHTINENGYSSKYDISLNMKRLNELLTWTQNNKPINIHYHVIGTSVLDITQARSEVRMRLDSILASRLIELQELSNEIQGIHTMIHQLKN